MCFLQGKAFKINYPSVCGESRAGIEFIPTHIRLEHFVVSSV